MTHLIKLFCFTLIFILLGCHEPKADPNLTASPYGVWVSDKGHSFDIMRNGTYKFCMMDKCEEGKTRNGSILLDFFQMKVTQKLINDTKEDYHNRAAGRGNDYFLQAATEFEGGIVPWEKKRICKNNPCFKLGEMESGQEIFVKTLEY